MWRPECKCSSMSHTRRDLSLSCLWQPDGRVPVEHWHEMGRKFFPSKLMHQLLTWFVSLSHVLPVGTDVRQRVQIKHFRVHQVCKSSQGFLLRLSALSPLAAVATHFLWIWIAHGMPSCVLQISHQVRRWLAPQSPVHNTYLCMDTYLCLALRPQLLGWTAAAPIENVAVDLRVVTYSFATSSFQSLFTATSIWVTLFTRSRVLATHSQGQLRPSRALAQNPSSSSGSFGFRLTATLRFQSRFPSSGTTQFRHLSHWQKCCVLAITHPHPKIKRVISASDKGWVNILTPPSRIFSNGVLNVSFTGGSSSEKFMSSRSLTQCIAVIFVRTPRVPFSRWFIKSVSIIRLCLRHLPRQVKGMPVYVSREHTSSLDRG